MLGFILRRTVYAVPSLFGLLVVTFLMVRVVPADPAAALAGDNATPQQIAQIRHQYGFDRPLAVQLARYLGQVVALQFRRERVLAPPGRNRHPPAPAGDSRTDLCQRCCSQPCSESRWG